MDRDIQRIGIGNSKYAAIGKNDLNLPKPGFFTFDSTTVRFDSMVDTFDFDIISLVQPGFFSFDSSTVQFDSMVDTFDFDVMPL
jgi:hypothetical protein